MTSLEQALADAKQLRETLPLMRDSLESMRFWLAVMTITSASAVALAWAVAMSYSV